MEQLITALKKIEQMSDCGSYENAIVNMKAIATEALKSTPIEGITDKQLEKAAGKQNPYGNGIYNKSLCDEWVAFDEGFKSGAKYILPHSVDRGREAQLWGFFYNQMVHESSAALISLHRSKDAAEKAMNIHKDNTKKEFEALYKDEELQPYKFGEFESWFVDEIKISE